MPKLSVVICSTRPGRVGPHVGKWFAEEAARHGKFEVKLVDLLEVGLPLLDEPEHPRYRKYQNAPTKRWAEIVEGSDAFAFVTPEYDYVAPATLVNALQCLAHEWAYKVAGLVSYSVGPFGGVRAQISIKPLMANLKLMPIPESVAIGMVNKHINEGSFVPEPPILAQTKTMLDELLRWADALKVLR
jgi:NAD(P)H-dependent FMN reductase